MKWNKLYLRDMDEEELEHYDVSDGVIWGGQLPDVDEWVIIKRYKDDEPSIDRWDADGELMGFYYNNDIEECYWISVPDFEE